MPEAGTYPCFNLPDLKQEANQASRKDLPDHNPAAGVGISFQGGFCRYQNEQQYTQQPKT
jgi:hypothetical protein